MLLFINPAVLFQLTFTFIYSTFGLKFPQMLLLWSIFPCLMVVMMPSWVWVCLLCTDERSLACLFVSMGVWVWWVVGMWCGCAQNRGTILYVTLIFVLCFSIFSPLITAWFCNLLKCIEHVVFFQSLAMWPPFVRS